MSRVSVSNVVFGSIILAPDGGHAMFLGSDGIKFWVWWLEDGYSARYGIGAIRMMEVIA